MHNPVRSFGSSPGVIRHGVIMYIRDPLSLMQVKTAPFEQGIGTCYETVRSLCDHFALMSAAAIENRGPSAYLVRYLEGTLEPPSRPRAGPNKCG